ncbi:hypothetical protein MY11210_003665 [Beauveria gryllotalpidicola]
MASATESRSDNVHDHDEDQFPGPHKRKAIVPDTDSIPAEKRHCLSAVRRHGQLDAVAPMSLNDSMLAESRTRLYVHPIAWTDRQLELLRVGFDGVKTLGRQYMGDQAILDTTCAPKLTGLPWDSDSTLRATENLFSLNLGLQKSAMADLLRSFGLRTEGCEPCRRIEMRFRGQIACQLDVEGLWRAKAGDRMMIYTNFDAISELRKKWVHGKKGTTSRNGVGLEVKRKKERALKPKKAHKDPYIWSLLIALAQAQRKLEPDVQRWRVLLLAIPGIGAQRLYCYECWVPAQLLKKLDEPSSEVACPQVTVSIIKMSLTRPREAARCLWEELHENELC